MVKIIKRESITSDCALYNEFLEEHIEKERIDAIISPVQ